ncbi:acyltransferase family protein [Nocardioides sp.]|uniref:acyltransferase family protein n=1 Tax=Nocardioides sp. TaxID=35761 RepID=UPI0031FED825
MTQTTAPIPGAAAAEPDQPAKPARTNYRTDIDGIRGTAAIMVMGFHAKVPGFEGAYIGLDLFFVVSGFVIAGLLFNELSKSGRISWPAFYARRVRRLIPAKATMLVGILILSYFTMLPTGGQQATAKSAAAASMFVSNFYFWRDSTTSYFGHEPGTGVLLHTWSLSVEEQFYLAVPLVILVALLLSRLTKIAVRGTLLFFTVALLVASLVAAIVLSTNNHDFAYYLPMTRAFEFLLGVALALVAPKLKLKRWVAQALGVAGGLLLLAVLIKPMPVDVYPSYWAMLPCLGTAAMVWAGCDGKTAITHFLSFRLFAWLGLISYGWYLWHWPLLVMGESVNLAPPPLWVRIMLVMVALLIAWLSYTYIEGIFYQRNKSATTRKAPRPPRVVLLAGASTMALVASLAGGALLIAKHEAQSPKWLEVSKQLTDIPQLPYECIKDTHGTLPTTPKACNLNTFVEGRPTVVLWGDSHAWMLIPALVQAGQGADVNLVSYTMGGCVPHLEELPPITARSTFSTCQRSNDRALAFVTQESKAGNPIRVILGASWDDYGDGPSVSLMDRRDNDPVHIAMLDRSTALLDKVPLLFQRLGSLGVGTDVVAPTAEVPRSAPLCEAGFLPFSCDATRTDTDAAQAHSRQWLTDLLPELPAGAKFIDLDTALCGDKICPAETDGIVNFFDDDHISATRATMLADYFRPSIDAVVESANLAAAG